MTVLPIQAEAVRKKPKYHATARELLQQCREFYQNPENEKVYQEWKARRQTDELYTQK